MSSDRELPGLVCQLVDSKREGEWWDFKRQWPSKEDLLFDLVCLANNTQLRDAYLIIGVDEENDFSYRDVSTDKNRKNTQQLVDFLKSQPFAGDNVPNLRVHTWLSQNGKAIDIIEIEASKEAPYFFRQNRLGMNAGAIYTRTVDSNTPKGKSANYRQVEVLWRNHFGLSDAPIERLAAFLRDDAGWQDSLEHSEGPKEFYVQHPEFTIEHVSDESLSGYEYYHFEQTDNSPHWYEIFVRYHQTVIAGMQGVALDGGRYFTSVPDREFIRTPSHSGLSLEKLAYSYCYFIEGSLNYLMHKHFFKKNTDDERIAYERFLRTIVIYKHEKEKNYIDDLIQEDPRSLETRMEHITPYVYLPDELPERARKNFMESLKLVRFIQDELERSRGAVYPFKLMIKEDKPNDFIV